MRKKSSTNKFIENCYNKFKANRSLTDIKPNPLLVPNSAQEGSLCAFSIKKGNRNYHHKTITDWVSYKNLGFERKLKDKKFLNEDKKNMENMLLICNMQNSIYHTKLKCQVKQRKKERSNMFKNNNKGICVESEVADPKNRIKNLLTFSYDRFVGSEERGKKWVCESAQTQNQKRKPFPNRPNFKKDLAMNESHLTVRGWDSDPQSEECLNLSATSKYRFKS